jgi:hypothetical protein
MATVVTTLLPVATATVMAMVAVTTLLPVVMATVMGVTIHLHHIDR